MSIKYSQKIRENFKLKIPLNFPFSANSAANLWKITRPEQPNGEQATRFVPCWANRKVVAKAMEKLEETESRDWSKDEIRIR